MRVSVNRDLSKFVNASHTLSSYLHFFSHEEGKSRRRPYTKQSLDPVRDHLSILIVNNDRR